MDPGLLFLFLLSALFIFRVSELIVFDNGPWHIFRKLRNVFEQGSKLDEMIECIYCMGIWISLFLTLFLVWRDWIDWDLAVLWWPASAGAAIVIYRTIRPRK